MTSMLSETRKTVRAYCSVRFDFSLRHDENKDGFRSNMARGRKVIMGEAPGDVQHPCNIYDCTRRGYTVYMDFGLVTESELFELITMEKNSRAQAAWKQEAVTIENHLGVRCRQYFISLAGLDVSTIYSIRKIRFQASASMTQDEMLFQAARQFEEDQAGPG